MPRSRSTFCTVFLATLCFFCAAGTTLAQPLSCNFAAKVHFLAPGVSGAPLVAGDLLDQLYEPSGPWPDFFAAISPDEDFVETYKFKC